MDKNKALQELKKTLFFQVLTEKSRQTLLKKWELLTDEQIRKILFLTINESMMAHYLGQIGRELLDETQKKAARKMVKKLEAANESREEKMLNNIIQDSDI